MSKKKDEQLVTAAEDLGAVVVDTSSTAGGDCPSSVSGAASFSPEGGSQSGAAGDDGAEILCCAQDDESLVQAEGGGTVKTVPYEQQINEAKVKLIADRNVTVPEIKDGKILLRAAFGATVYANARRMIGCGVFVEIPAGYTGFIIPSLRLRENWGIVCQGVRMPGESGEVSVTLINCGIRDCDIQPGEVIAEMVIVPCLEVEV